VAAAGRGSHEDGPLLPCTEPLGWAIYPANYISPTMKPAKGIQRHAFFKLGKAPAKTDPRNFKFAALLKKVPPPTPPQYDFDVAHPGIPTPMFANDVHGDCVIAARAHLTLRFEDIEQGSILMISDNDVLKEYFKESGGADDGLNLLDSLNSWRQNGWRAARRQYQINAFAQITPTDHAEVQAAIYLLSAAYVGLALPKSAQAQIQTGQPWAVASGPAAVPNSWGGHCVTVPGYNVTGPVCVTWGRKQQMTWAFFDQYCDEAYAVVDDKDSAKSRLDVAKLLEALRSLRA